MEQIRMEKTQHQQELLKVHGTMSIDQSQLGATYTHTYTLVHPKPLQIRMQKCKLPDKPALAHYSRIDLCDSNKKKEQENDRRS